MTSNIMNLIQVPAFDPNEFLVVYRKQTEHGEEDRIYLPLRVAHEWFLLKHPDGSVQATYDLVGPEHVIAHAVVRYNGQDVTDAYADGYRTEQNPNFVANAIRAAKRAALANAGFGVPHDAQVTDNTPIILIENETDMPDGSFDGSLLKKAATPKEEEVPAEEAASANKEKKKKSSQPASQKRKTKKATAGQKKEEKNAPEAEKNAEAQKEEVDHSESTEEPAAPNSGMVEIDMDEMSDDEGAESSSGSESESEAPQSAFLVKSGIYKGLTFEEVCDRAKAAGQNPTRVIASFTGGFQDEETRAAAFEFLKKLNNEAL